MKFNEGIMRSPKWLRNFIDFEINTGEDIKGEPSERRKRKLVKEEDARIEKKRAEEEAAERTRRTREKARYQKKVNEDLIKLRQLIVDDWKKAPYNDKCETPIRKGVRCMVYTFENGETLDMCNNIIEHYKVNGRWTKYTLSNQHRNQFVDIFNTIVKIGINRPKSGSGKNKGKIDTGNPKRKTYDNILSTIKQREDQLRSMSPNDEDYDALRKDLESAKRGAARMKNRYNFEHLTSPYNFIKY